MPIEITDITNSSATGILDALMKAIKDLVETQFEAGRLTGADYAAVLLGATQSAITESIAFAGLAADNALKVAESAADISLKGAQEELTDQQKAASIAEVAIQQAQSTQDLSNKAAQITSMVADTAIKGAQSTQDILNKAAQVTLTNAEEELTDQQKAASVAEIAIQQTQSTKDALVKDAQITSMTADNTLKAAQKLKVDAEELLVDAQTASIGTDDAIKESQSVQDLALKETQTALTEQQILKEQAEVTFVLTKGDNATIEGTLLTAQKDKAVAETALIAQKEISEYGQTEILTTAGSPTVGGVIGSQKTLYQQQANGFRYQAAQDVLKSLTDMWNVSKTQNDVVLPSTDTSAEGGGLGTPGVIYQMLSQIYGQVGAGTYNFTMPTPVTTPT